MAPRFMASIASSVEVWAVIMMTGVGQALVADAWQQVEAVAVGHLDVAEDDVGARADRGRHALGVVGRGRDLEALLVEEQLQHVAQRLLVVDDQQPGAAHWMAPGATAVRWAAGGLGRVARQENRHGCPLSRLGFDVDRAPVVFDDAPDDGHAEPGAAVEGRGEGREDAGDLFLAHPAAGVAELGCYTRRRPRGPRPSASRRRASRAPRSWRRCRRSAGSGRGPPASSDSRRVDVERDRVRVRDLVGETEELEDLLDARRRRRRRPRAAPADARSAGTPPGSSRGGWIPRR